MKTELLTAYATLGDLINALPNDPLPVPAAPTGLRIVGAAGSNPRTLLLAWDYFGSPLSAYLEVKGAEGNPAGPQEWTLLDYNGSGPDGNGTMFTYVLENPAGQSILFRLRAQNMDGAFSDPIEITVNADDYLPQ